MGGVSKKGGLLVGDARRQGQSFDMAQITGCGGDRGKAVDWHAEERAKLWIPGAFGQVHEGGAGGGSDIGGKMPGQPVPEIGVRGAQPQVPVGCQRTGLRDFAQDPAEFAGREVGIKWQACPFQHHRPGPFRRKAGSLVLSPGILPDNHGPNRLAGPGVPSKAAFPLVRQSDRLHRTRGATGLDAGTDMGEELLSVVFDPAIAGIGLVMGQAQDGGDAAIGMNAQRPRAGSALVDSKDGHGPSC